MKKSYKRLLLFSLLIIVLLLLNSFVSNILTATNMILFLLISLITFKQLLGFEKDRHRYTKDIIMDIIVFLLIYFILYYLLGIIIGFAKTENYYQWLGFKNYIIPITIQIILTEILRYMMIVKTGNNKWLLTIICIIFICLDITNPIYYQTFQTKYDSFIFLALTLLPAISKNVVCTYISSQIGYKPVIFYLLVITLYPYLLPIVPNPNEYLTAIIALITPLGVGLITHNFISKENDEFTQTRIKQYTGIIITIPLIIGIVYFTSGYFKYYAIAIASGSMQPTINKGDVVIIEKINKQYQNLKVGQVIAYRYNNVIVVHRLEKVVKDKGKYYFYTKGDANNNPDMYTIEENMIIGIINMKIPYIGTPTVWLNEL